MDKPQVRRGIEGDSPRSHSHDLHDEAADKCEVADSDGSFTAAVPSHCLPFSLSGRRPSKHTTPVKPVNGLKTTPVGTPESAMGNGPRQDSMMDTPAVTGAQSENGNLTKSASMGPQSGKDTIMRFFRKAEPTDVQQPQQEQSTDVPGPDDSELEGDVSMYREEDGTSERPAESGPLRSRGWRWMSRKPKATKEPAEASEAQSIAGVAEKLGLKGPGSPTHQLGEATPRGWFRSSGRAANSRQTVGDVTRRYGLDSEDDSANTDLTAKWKTRGTSSSGQVFNESRSQSHRESPQKVPPVDVPPRPRSQTSNISSPPSGHTIAKLLASGGGIQVPITQVHETEETCSDTLANDSPFRIESTHTLSTDDKEKPVTPPTARSKHRRHSSLSSFFGLRKKEEQYEVDPQSSNTIFSEVSLPGEDALGRPRVPTSKQNVDTVSRSGGLSCFGMPRTLNDYEPDTEQLLQGLLSGTVGLQNLGNTCFINSALQCIRCTPDLLASLSPNLLNSVPVLEPFEHLPSPQIPGLSIPMTVLPGTTPLTMPCVLPSTSPEALSLVISDSERRSAPVTGPESYPESPTASMNLLPIVSRTSVSSTDDIGPDASSKSAVKSTPDSNHPPGNSDIQPLPLPTELPPTKPPSRLVTSQAPSSSNSNSAASVKSIPDDALADLQASMLDVLASSTMTGTDTPVVPVTSTPLPLDPVTHDPTSEQTTSEQATSTRHSAPSPSEPEPLAVASTTTTEVIEATGSCEDDKLAGSVDTREEAEFHEAEADVQQDELKVSSAPAVKPTVTTTEVAESLLLLMAHLCIATQAAPLNPHGFFQHLRYHSQSEHFCDGGQHDAQELVRVLLELLNDAHNRVKEKPAYKEEVDEPDELPNAKADRMWGSSLAREASPITDMFLGQLQSRIVCHECSSTYYTYEPFMDLSLSLSRDGKATKALLRKKKALDNVEDCLKAFTGEERLEGDEAFYCSKCKARGIATKTLRVHRFPKCLLLHIKRFKLQSKQHVKMVEKVSFPLTDLNLGQFASDGCTIPPEDICYDLYAVSNHSGSLTSGHYTAICKLQNSEGTQSWYSFDDETVTPVAADKVNSANAYMMFYTLREPAGQIDNSLVSRVASGNLSDAVQ